MTKMTIPLNGSNFISDQRNQAFNQALNDEHRIDCGCDDPIRVQTLPAEKPSPPAPVFSPETTDTAAVHVLSRALEHTYRHQTRTMEIHQLYLAQQDEYLQLITAVLDQQGKALDQNGGAAASHLVDTFQRTLDNFHALREQGTQVHQEFLHQQAAFSERYLNALENGQPLAGGNGHSGAHPSPPQESSPMAWIVQQPAIVVDDQSGSADTSPEETTPEVPEIKPASLPAGISSQMLADSLLEIVAEKTGYPVEMLELNLDLEADLGIDSIKRVEILGALEEQYPALPPGDTEILSQTRTLQEIIATMDGSLAGVNDRTPQGEPSEVNAPSASLPGSGQQAASQNDRSQIFEGLTEILLEIVADKTGYPAEMLEADMDLEADLGIDSIKRVEILGAMEERVPGLPSVPTENLAEQRTLGQIVDLMERAATSQLAPAGDLSGDKKKAEAAELRISPVRLKTLPQPDQLEFEPDPDRPLIISLDPEGLALKAAQSLQEQGWRVVLWAYPGPSVEVPVDLLVIQQSSNGIEAINTALDSIRKDHGSPIGFLHFHPHSGEEGLFTTQEDLLIKQVFLLAGALKEDLHQQPQSGRNLFMIVNRSDGALGLRAGTAFQKGNGLSGLVKTLRWEWPQVFCRFVDLDQTLSPDRSWDSLLREISDPDRGLVEVGISADSRVTIERDQGNSHD